MRGVFLLDQQKVTSSLCSIARQAELEDRDLIKHIIGRRYVLNDKNMHKFWI